MKKYINIDLTGCITWGGEIILFSTIMYEKKFMFTGQHGR
jgi:hypothetical protein